MPEATVDEFIAVCISRQVADGELVVQGIATPLVAAGYLLAKLTHAPNITFASAIGQAICQEPAPLGIATIERLWLERGLVRFGFVTIACDLLECFQPKEFFRPGQVDPFGNCNNIFMGGTHSRPRLRLPGSGGIPDVTAYSNAVYLYVPRHGRHTFAPEVDCRSGLGHTPGRQRGQGPHYLVSDLGQFDFASDHGRMRLVSLHPGVSLKRVQMKTGFDLVVPKHIPETPSPSALELKLLREEIDPLGVRQLETLRGAARRRKLEEILQEEASSGHLSFA